MTADEVGDVTKLELTTRVNGEVRQHGFVADLINDIPSIIEYVTTFTPLAPGDVIVTGTPGGVGLFMEPQGFVGDGDVVEVEVTGLGTLRNVVREVDSAGRAERDRRPRALMPAALILEEVLE